MAYVNSFQSRFWISDFDGCAIVSHFNRNRPAPVHRPIPAPLRQFEKIHLQSPRVYIIEAGQSEEVDFNVLVDTIRTFTFIKLSSCCIYRFLHISCDTSPDESLKVMVHNPSSEPITILKGSILCDLYIKC